MNCQATIDGDTVDEATKTNSAPALAEPGVDGNVYNDETLANCSQTNAADSVYDLCIRNQALLWKALPKPSNTSQVRFHYCQCQCRS